MTPVVTFVIPAYNEGRFLKEVIDRIYELPLQNEDRRRGRRLDGRDVGGHERVP